MARSLRKKTSSSARATWPRNVEIFEVSPRDGLQAESRILSPEDRAELVLRLCETGLRDIEIGSFVRADRIPQLQNTEKVVEIVRERLKNVATKKRPRLWAFVPNHKGLENAIAAGVDGVGLFVAASGTFCLKNVNRTQAELLSEIKTLLPAARRHKLKARVYVSTIVHCPYEKEIAPKRVASLVDKLVDLGAEDISLGDTTGYGTPRSIKAVLEAVLKKHSPDLFALHLHDTRGTALANALEGLEFGIRRFDASAGGTGGCPYAPGASGNLATEDLLYMFQGMGWLKNVSIEKLAIASRHIEALLGRRLPSKMLQTLG